MKSIKLSKNLLLILILVGLGSLRFINLSADPVPLLWLHNQDEGNYSYNTRNLVLENKLVTDDVNFFFVSPLWTMVQFPIVKTFGIHFESFRFPAALSPIILAVVIFLFLFKVTNNRWLSFLGGLLVISNFLILVHSRFAMPETTNLLFLTLGFACWYFALEKYPSVQAKWSILTGLFWTAAFLTKGNGISLGLMLVSSLTLLIINRRQLPNFRQALKLTLPFFIFGFVFLGTRLLFKATYPEQFAIATIELTEKYRPLIRSQILNPVFWQEETKEFLTGGEGNAWQFVPFLVIGALFFAVITTKKLIKHQQTLLLEITALAFLIGSLSWYWLIVYKPARYFLLIVPALVISNLLLIKLKPRIGLILIALTLLFDVGLSVKYIYSSYTYNDVAIGKAIKREVDKNALVAGGGLDSWTLNEDFHFLNTYFPGWDEHSLLQYFAKYSWPKYLMLHNQDQIRLANNEKTALLEPQMQFVLKTPLFNPFADRPLFINVYKINHQTN